MKVKITIPEYLSVDNFKRLQNLEHLTDLNKLVETIHVFTNIDKEEIIKWSPKDMGIIANDLTSAMDYKEIFYPIIQINDVNYGYADISQMTLGEFIDLERLCKEPVNNLAEIMTILYRPIVKHKFNKMSWKTLHGVRLFTEKLDNVFKWYDIKDYNSKDRETNAEIMKQLPVQFAQGAMGFFLGLVNLSLANMNPYLDKKNKTQKRGNVTLTRKTLETLTSIGDGLRQYINYPKQTYSVSQEKQVLLS